MLLLIQGRARVFRKYPFTIIIQDLKAETCITHNHQLKIDPGAKTTGLAIVQGHRVVWGAELTHRGSLIRNALTSRRQVRHSRRNRKTRYRQPRFLNRRKPKGWLAPSLMSRVHNILTWVRRLIRFCPIAGISQELVKFDTQKMLNLEISGAEYQQGPQPMVASVGNYIVFSSLFFVPKVVDTSYCYYQDSYRYVTILKRHFNC